MEKQSNLSFEDRIERMSDGLTPKVISILRVMHPQFQKWFYARELSKLADVSTWVVSREFSGLVKQKIIKERRGEGKNITRLICRIQRLGLYVNCSNQKEERLCLRAIEDSPGH